MFKKISIAIALIGFTASAFAAPVSYKIDSAHTTIVASWNHLGFSNPVAHFGEVDGTIVYDAAKVAASKVNVTIPMSGMDANVDAFNNHLRSAELFDVEKYPTMTFYSTKVQAAGKNKLLVTGNLTIRGVTKTVVLNVKLNGQGMHPMAKKQAIGFDASTTIKRSDFGLAYAVPAVGDNVTISITTEALVL